MASTPSPASSSDPAPADRGPTGRSDRPGDRRADQRQRRPPVSAEGPGRLRVASVVGDEVREATGAEALGRAPGAPAATRRPASGSTWPAPTRDQVEAVGAALGLHPLIVEDVLEGNQRAKIETTDGVVHIVLFHLDYDAALVASEMDIVLGDRFLLTAHDALLGPARLEPPARRRRPDPQARPGPPAVGARRRHRRRLLPLRRPARRRHRRGPGRGRPQDRQGDPSSDCSSSSASSSTSAGRSAPSARSSTS